MSSEWNKLTKFENLEAEFVEMTNEIKEALISNVNIVLLIEQLCTVSAVNDQKVPLFDEDTFEKIELVDEFWNRLKMFWSIFDFDLLQFVIKLSECEMAQTILEELLSKCDPSVVEDANLVACCRVEPREQSLKSLLRIKISANGCDSNVLQNTKKVVLKTYNLQKHSLCFKGVFINEGCIELLYYISKAVMTYFLQFEVTGNNFTELTDNEIISLQINGYKLQIPYKTDDITVSTVN